MIINYKVRYVMYAIFFICILIISILFPNLVHAETRITDGYLYTGGHFVKDASPYILEDNIVVPKGQKLIIDPGVTIQSVQPLPGEDPYTINVKGELYAIGTAQDPIRINGLEYIIINQSNNTILKSVDLEHTGLDISYSTTSLSSVKIRHASPALYAKQSRIVISQSELVDNNGGVFSALWSPGPFLMMNRDDEGIGGIGNALGLDPRQNDIVIHDSIFINNSEYDIQNKTANLIDASDNWWGVDTGPGTRVVGAVNVEPWKTKDPTSAVCCSNVLFLPGLEASRLYRDESTIFGTTTNTLWEPNRKDDVRKLFLNNQGKSIDPSIYTSDVLDKAFGVKNIYARFVAMMNSVVAEKVINRWLPYAYDWRMGVSDVAMGSTKYSTTTRELLQDVKDLAQSSKTGKVTIIAHSNGGLVAKMLGVELEKRGLTHLIDRVILVAVPQLGTPQAIASMLHGDGQSILGGAVLSASVARTLGINMPGAYGLLPSQKFFENHIDPVILRKDGDIDSYSTLVDFLTGNSGGRSQPRESDLKTPALLNPELISKSDWLHSILDTWSFPTTTDIITIAGWGLPTTEKIDYTGSSPEVVKDTEGDGTVLVDSARGYEKNTMFFNQALYAHDNKWGSIIEHANILESDSVRSLLSRYIASSTKPSSSPLPEYITSTKPNTSDYPWLSWIRVSVHSPVNIDMYNSHGGHLGIVPLPTDPNSDLQWLDNTLGGIYDAIGDEKYVIVPADDTYSIQLSGVGYGTFSFEVEKLVGGNMVKTASTTYTDLPVTPLLMASTTISSDVLSPTLNLDFDGNGVVDTKVASSTTLDPQIHIDSFKVLIKSLHLSSAIEKKLIQRVDKLGDLNKKGKSKAFARRIKSFEHMIVDTHWKHKKLSQSDRDSLQKTLESLISTLEHTND